MYIILTDTLFAMDQSGVVMLNQGRFQEAETILTPLVESCKGSIDDTKSSKLGGCLV